jgi:hypothetical protein
VDPSSYRLLAPRYACFGSLLLRYTGSIVPGERARAAKDPEGDVVGDDEDGNEGNTNWDYESAHATIIVLYHARAGSVEGSNGAC